jgi:hypothetical protein
MIEHTLMAGVVGTEIWGVDENGKVFALDEKGKPIKEAPASIAKQVREQIERGKAAAREHGKEANRDLEWHKKNCKNCIELAPEQWDLCEDAQQLLANS